MAYTATYERDEDGWWIVEVKEVQGCHSDGRTLKEARKRIRQALELFDIEGEVVELVEDIRLPVAARQALERMKKVRAKADEAQSAAAAATAEVVQLLTGELGLSVRDVADLVELSFQRIHQLTHLKASARRVRPERAARRVSKR